MKMHNKIRKDEDMLATLRIAICSDLRRNILVSLYDGGKSLSNLRSELQISSSTAIHALRELQKNTLVFQDKNRNYLLTSIGRIIALKLLDFSDAAEVLKEHRRFWIEHDLTGIPDYLLEKIGWLKDSKLIQIDPLDIVKTHSSYINFIKKAKWVKGVSPIFSPDYPSAFKELVNKNIYVKVILTNAVLKKLIEAVGWRNLKNSISNHCLDILITDEDLKVAFTATNGFISLGLFTTNGVYDVKYDLISTSERAVHWGVELFEYYREKATPLELDAFKDLLEPVNTLTKNIEKNYPLNKY
ncbi:putative transcriptional regulator [Candidatus Methanoperedens nitroreducens]|uniref:Putative transcriptional regulator n=1 Tax=Candidatus Methanoperedens nitratireducens TaxID=1392998 RepID=A0A062UZP5_9EURY|nr:winged helix-turn-helix domain-containing protein [Candidatus Methanoperedens nitroreducens]KCZ72386.1 putative transcriptional regulator [Candidatus Methanoperedens nitroreducens]MDJ1423680.1 winged helix-turn-helix domain-containing protein [Candidatus Methanoperedens sp.]